MILGIATGADSSTSPVDTYFGRCRWFCIYNSETQSSLFIENPCHDSSEKAGLSAVAMLVRYGVEAAVAGRFGSKVVEELRSRGVQLIVVADRRKVSDLIACIK